MAPFFFVWMVRGSALGLFPFARRAMLGWKWPTGRRPGQIRRPDRTAGLNAGYAVRI
jgi:hypothetical protein